MKYFSYTIAFSLIVIIVRLESTTTIVNLEVNPEKAVTTFTEDVAPILYKHCVKCHRAGEMAPMSLITYKETRPWARSIKNKILSNEMPPWHANPIVGKFLNERRLSEADKATIIQWVNEGAIEGDPNKLPEKPRFAIGWKIGTPDVVITMPTAFKIPAEGYVPYQFFTVPTHFTEDTWVQAIEVRPGTPSVVHHILVYARIPRELRPANVFKLVSETRYTQRTETLTPGVLIGTMAPGTNPLTFAPDTALRIPKGTELVFQIHYTTNGQETLDQSQIGLILADSQPRREIRSGYFANMYFKIPAGEPNQRVDTIVEFTDEAEVFGLFPHTHLRGKKWEYRLIHPDGKWKTILSVPKYDFNWQTYYIFEQPLLVTKGDQIQASAWYDNSETNKANPDPTTAVKWGEQTWEEMQYSGITYSIPTVTSDSNDSP